MIKLIVDTAADIPKEFTEKYKIEVLPLIITLGDEVITADKDLDISSYYKKLKNSTEFPKTSQVPPQEIEDLYRKIGADRSSIIHITISSKGSGTFNTASMIARELNNEGFDITVVDSMGYSMFIGKPVMIAAEMIEKGCSKNEIIDFLEDSYANDRIYFIVDDLEYLKRGGRIKATTMAISKMLDIKPILQTNDGLVEAFLKVRGMKKALSRLVELAEERMEEPSVNEAVIVNSDMDENVELLKEMLKDRLGVEKITVYNIGAIITSHTGVGVVGLWFRHKR